MNGHRAEAVSSANDNSRSAAEGKAPLPLGGYSKRIIDFAIALVALALASPIMLMIAVILKLWGGSPIFVHRRIGFEGQEFDCYKFRSMVANPDEVLRKHLENNPEATAEWTANQKLSNDPRVTFFGRMLRLSSLDELPQLFNVLRGEMSCVGPRPVTSEELNRYGIHVRQYLRARPGITGLWQVSGRARIGYERRIELDTEYVANWSLRTDIAILSRTVFAVLRFNETS